MNDHDIHRRAHHRMSLRYHVIAAMLAVFTGCGDNLNPGATPDATTPDAPEPDAGGDQQAPQARIIFPPVMGVTDSPEIMVRGTASDASGVASIRVNGFEAETLDDHAEWTVNVPLSHGINDLVVEAVDVHGNRDGNAAAVAVRLAAYPALLMRDIALDGANDRFLITDLVMGAVLAVHTNTGEHTLIASPARGSGPALATQAIAVSGAGDGTIYVPQSGAWGVLAVDAATGNRSVVTDASRGTGPAIASVAALAVHPGDGRILVLDGTSQAIIAVDQGTGDRVYLSGGGAGMGPDFVLTADMTVDAVNDRALVVDRIPGGLIAVDLSSGDRTVLSDDSTGGGVLFQDPGAVAVDAAGQVAWIVDNDALAVLAVDLTTGMRQILSGATTGGGPMFVEGTHIVHHAAGDRLVMTDRDTMYDLDTSSGDRSVFFDFRRGDGMYRYGSPTAIAWDVAGGRLYVSDPAHGRDVEIDAVVAVAIDTGDREIISAGNSEGSRGMALDGQRLLLADAESEELIAVDTTTGERVALVNGGVEPIDVAVDEEHDRYLFTGSGEAGVAIHTVPRSGGAFAALATVTGLPRGIVVDPSGARALVAHIGSNAIIAYDLTTGDSTDISTTGDVPVGDPGELALDARHDRVLAVGRAEGLYAIDMTTGARHAISNASTGRGPLWRLDDVALDSDNDVAAVLDSGLEAVLLVDTRTGDRIMISR